MVWATSCTESRIPLRISAYIEYIASSTARVASSRFIWKSSIHPVSNHPISPSLFDPRKFVYFVPSLGKLYFSRVTFAHWHLCSEYPCGARYRSGGVINKSWEILRTATHTNRGVHWQPPFQPPLSKIHTRTRWQYKYLVGNVGNSSGRSSLSSTLVHSPPLKPTLAHNPRPHNKNVRRLPPTYIGPAAHTTNLSHFDFFATSKQNLYRLRIVIVNLTKTN